MSPTRFSRSDKGAPMAVVFSNIKHYNEGGMRLTLATCTGPASYTTGGEALTAAQQASLMPENGVPAAVNMSAVKFFESEQSVNGRWCVLDRTNNKLIYWTDAGEAGSGTNQSTFGVTVAFRYG